MPPINDDGKSALDELIDEVRAKEAGDEPAKKPDQPAKEEPPVDPPAKEEPAAKTEEPKAKEEPTKTPDATAKADEPVDDGETLETLRAKLQAAHSIIQRYGEEPEAPAKPNDPAKQEPAKGELEKKPAVDPADAARDQISFVNTQEEIDEAITSVAGMNKLLNAVYQKGVETGQKNIPELVRATARNENAIQNFWQGFWAENAQLKPFHRYVGVVAHQVEKAHPEYTHDEFKKAVAEKVKTDLNFHVKAQKAAEAKKADPPEEDTPAFARGSKGVRAGQVKMTKEQELLQELVG